jgi:hypothetical protein
MRQTFPLHGDTAHDGVNTIYTQHELTASEIRRDKGRQAAIDRNRAGAVKRRKHDINDVTIVRVNDSASDAQKGLIVSLLKDLAQLDQPTWATAGAWWFGDGQTPGAITTATKPLASQTIERLKIRITEAKGRTTPPTVRREAAPVARPAYTPRDRFADVPDGYYAVMTNDDVLAFYRVSTWKSGDRRVQVQASDALHLVRGHKSTDAILAKVRLATPIAAGKRYATELGNCYRCGRTLTDDESRARGIGPVCVNK